MADEETAGTSQRSPKQDQPQGPKLWLTGPARHAATILCALVTLGGIAWTLHGIRAPSMIDTTVRMRPAGGAIPVYSINTGGTPFHQLKPGDKVHLSASKAAGTRFPAHIDIDEGERMGWIEEADFDGDDLGRMRAVLAAKGY